MSVPREIVKGRFYMLSRRCTQRRFLLKPGPVMNAIFLYCLAIAARLFGIEVILTTVLSNHHHTVFYDRSGHVIEFIEHLHKLVARAGNALRRRRENFWSSDPPSLVHLLAPADVIDKLVYAATNPVKDHLVERVHHWPGVTTLRELLAGEAVTIARPQVFFRKDGPMPAAAELELTIPPELGDASSVRDRLRERVAAVEEAVAAARRRTGKRVLGRRAVLQTRWSDSPADDERKRDLRPRVAARDAGALLAALRQHRAFVDAYRAARARWLTGAAALFPHGTYWLRRFANVPIAAAA